MELASRAPSASKVVGSLHALCDLEGGGVAPGESPSSFNRKIPAHTELGSPNSWGLPIRGTGKGLTGSHLSPSEVVNGL
ncbi:hypothetical protein CDL15_Pgr017297 [Punica granatum]|uniref:Uncharacterized protein n=1 Tax=Punica granatum TaxID=22663 RepID=A0A218Y3H5_PUNGR|nr:hypothetical protein CDL15_Pgr017297 [Punica granatum]